MKKFLLTIITAYLPLSAYAGVNHVDSLLKNMAYYDANHERIACDGTLDVLLCFDENEKPYSGNASAESRDDEQNLKADLVMKDGKLNGSVKIYENDKLSIEAYYINGLEEGIETNYYPDGKTYLITGYLNGKQHGTSQEYNEKGVLISTVSWKEDKQNGPMKEYYPSGNFKSISDWKDDVQHGISVFYDENGLITEKTLWVRGKAVKYFKK